MTRVTVSEALEKSDRARPRDCGAPERGFYVRHECKRCGAIFTPGNTTFLSEVEAGKPLNGSGMKVTKIFVEFSDYKIFQVNGAGAFVQFSDCVLVEDQQRKRYTNLLGRVVQMRELIKSRFKWGDLLPVLKRLDSDQASRLEEQRVVDAIFLAMEGEEEKSDRAINEAIAAATERVTDENRIRYVAACFIIAIPLAAFASLLAWRLHPVLTPYLIAIAFGAIGAFFSSATGIRSAELAPSRYGSMNYALGALRIGAGAIGAGALILAAQSELIGNLFFETFDDTRLAAKAAMLGFIAGFVERFVPDLLGNTTSAVKGR